MERERERQNGLFTHFSQLEKGGQGNALEET